MRNHIFTNLFLVLMIFIFFINNNFNVNAEITIKAMLKADINDKKLVTRQTGPSKLSCYYAIDNVHKSTTLDVGVPQNTIFAKFTIECNVKSVKVAVTKYSLEKFDTNVQWVSMTGVSMKNLGSVGIPKTIGSSIIDSFLLSADPSECLNAPDDGLGVLARAEMCFSFNAPPEYTVTYLQPCAKAGNIISDCPNSTPSPGGIPFPPGKIPPQSPNKPSENIPSPKLPKPPNSPDSDSPYCYYNYTPTSTAPSNTIITSTPSPSLICLNSSSSSIFSSFFFPLFFSCCFSLTFLFMI